MQHPWSPSNANLPEIGRGPPFTSGTVDLVDTSDIDIVRRVTLERALPAPASEELIHALKSRRFGSPVHQHIYACMYDRRANPPTNLEITNYVAEQTGRFYSQLQRRRRQVGELFQVEVRPGYRYELVGWLDETRQTSASINRRVRFQVLQSGRCNLCGRTVENDGVQLEVDHVIPQGWGGNNNIENLQPLCQECNSGKKDWYGPFDKYANQIREAAHFDEPHRRIASLLLAFNGDWVPADLVGAVASAKQFQADWKKRTRELRRLGWKIETRRAGGPGDRSQTFYRATATTPLPVGNLASIIRQIEKEQSKKKA
jgi:5-methylcytosine-specific restriction endonuclease McrA